MIGRTIAEAMCWYYSSTLFLLMPPPVGALFLLVWTGAFFWRLMYRPSARRTPRDYVGLRPLGSSIPWLGAAILTMLITYVAFTLASDHLFPHRPPSVDYFARYSASPWGWTATAFLFAVGAPMMEEFLFRGVVQHALERRFGPVASISGAALLFSVSHLRPEQFADFFVFGAAAGVLVYRTRSLWAGIAMHSTINGCIVLMPEKLGLTSVGTGHNATPFWGSVAVALAGAVVFTALVSRIRSAPAAVRSAVLESSGVSPSDPPPVALE